ncbi:hypothetical protein BH10CYA1_BH10CYA1_62570 [soil metagenome]
MPKTNKPKPLKLVSAKKVKPKVKPQEQAVYQLKITLSDAPLPIWRRLLLSANMPLCVVHEVFQIGMGWWNYHLYDFEGSGRHFGDLETADGDDRIEDSVNFTLNVRD